MHTPCWQARWNFHQSGMPARILGAKIWYTTQMPTKMWYGTAPAIARTTAVRVPMLKRKWAMSNRLGHSSRGSARACARAPAFVFTYDPAPWGAGGSHAPILHFISPSLNKSITNMCSFSDLIPQDLLQQHGHCMRQEVGGLASM